MSSETQEQLSATVNGSEVPDAVAFLDALAKPTVELDDLPAIPASLGLQETTACRLVSAILREESRLEDLERRAREDAQAWADFLGRRRERVRQVRTMIRDYMLRADVTKIQHPAFTLSVAKGRKSLDVKDEAACLALLKAKYPAAVKTTESIIKAELRTAVDSLPEQFKAIVEEVIGEPTLLIRRR